MISSNREVVIQSKELLALSPLRNLGARVGVSTGPINSTWPSANRAIFVPFSPIEDITVTRITVLPGSTPANNVDVGLYESNGTRLVSSGSTAAGGFSASVPTSINISDTVLYAHTMYYVAMAVDVAAASGWSLVNLGASMPFPLLGIRFQNSAFPLPSTATFGADDFAMLLAPDVALLLY